MPALMRFLFPANLEHPESTGRMDVFAWSAQGPHGRDALLFGGMFQTLSHVPQRIGGKSKASTLSQVRS